MHFNTQEDGGCRCSVHCRKGEGQAIALFSIPAILRWLFSIYRYIYVLILFANLCIFVLYFCTCIFVYLLFYTIVYICVQRQAGGAIVSGGLEPGLERPSLASAAPRIPPPAPPALACLACFPACLPGWTPCWRNPLLCHLSLSLSHTPP